MVADQANVILVGDDSSTNRDETVIIPVPRYYS